LDVERHGAGQSHEMPAESSLPEVACCSASPAAGIARRPEADERMPSLPKDLATPARPNDLPDLPVREVLPELVATLAAGPNAVLVAPPGAGKTTLVPLALLGSDWAANGRILLLEPRRLAARAAARRMASLLGEEVGETVGYAMRMEVRQSKKTRILVVTEG